MGNHKNTEIENVNHLKDELPTLAQSWLRSYYTYVKAFDKLMARYKALKRENKALRAELQNIKRDLECSNIDKRLLKFLQQWSNPVKHIRLDISNEEIIELYILGIKPYQIAKVLQENNGVNINYRTIISRIKRLRDKGIIK